MNPPYLTDHEIAEITAPLTQGAARCRFLTNLGVKVKRRPDGQPLVGRAEFEVLMQAHHNQKATEEVSETAPDWPALRNRVRYARGQKTKMRESTRA